jgi:phosphate transport system permease protein
MSAVLRDKSAVYSNRLAMFKARKRTNIIAITLALAAMAFGLFWLTWILFETA